MDAVEPELASDEYGPLARVLLAVLVRLRKATALIFRTHPDWGGPHLCHLVLERLAGFVNDETLKTVVDRVGYTLLTLSVIRFNELCVSGVHAKRS